MILISLVFNIIAIDMICLYYFISDDDLKHVYIYIVDSQSHLVQVVNGTKIKCLMWHAEW